MCVMFIISVFKCSNYKQFQCEQFNGVRVHTITLSPPIGYHLGVKCMHA